MDKLVKISLEAHQALVALAARKQRSLKDFLEQSINYFKILELDPKEIDAEGIRSEIKKLDRRIVSFFRTQENEKIAPILDELSIISKTIVESIHVAPDRKDIEGMLVIIRESINKVVTSQNNVARMMTETRSRELADIKQKARRVFSEYLDEVEKKGALSSRKIIDDKYQRLFETI